MTDDRKKGDTIPIEEQAAAAAGVLLLNLSRHMASVRPSGCLVVFVVYDRFFEFLWDEVIGDKKYAWKYALRFEEVRTRRDGLFEEMSGHWQRAINRFVPNLSECLPKRDGL